MSCMWLLIIFDHSSKFQRFGSQEVHFPLLGGLQLSFSVSIVPSTYIIINNMHLTLCLYKFEGKTWQILK